jgi:hypothetical protein
LRVFRPREWAYLLDFTEVRSSLTNQPWNTAMDSEDDPFKFTFTSIVFDVIKVRKRIKLFPLQVSAQSWFESLFLASRSFTSAKSSYLKIILVLFPKKDDTFCKSRR